MTEFIRQAVFDRKIEVLTQQIADLSRQGTKIVNRMNNILSSRKHYINQLAPIRKRKYELQYKKKLYHLGHLERKWYKRLGNIKVYHQKASKTRRYMLKLSRPECFALLTLLNNKKLRKALRRSI